jgi:hypothetical protein
VIKPEKVISLCKFDDIVEWFVRTQTTAKSPLFNAQAAADTHIPLN